MKRADEDNPTHQNNQKDESTKWEWNGRSNSFQWKCSACLRTFISNSMQCLSGERSYQIPSDKPTVFIRAPQTKQTNQFKKTILDETTGKLTPRSLESMMASQLAFIQKRHHAFRRIPAPTAQYLPQYCPGITDPGGFAFPDQTCT